MTLPHSGVRIGSFATGYDQIKKKVWLCPIHGEVSNDTVAWGGQGWFHLPCGRDVERRERLNSSLPLTAPEKAGS